MYDFQTGYWRIYPNRWKLKAAKGRLLEPDQFNKLPVCHMPRCFRETHNYFPTIHLASSMVVIPKLLDSSTLSLLVGISIYGVIISLLSNIGIKRQTNIQAPTTERKTSSTRKHQMTGPCFLGNSRNNVIFEQKRETCICCLMSLLYELGDVHLYCINGSRGVSMLPSSHHT